MDRRIEITRHDQGFTISDNRTGLRVEVFTIPNGLALEAYGYHSRTPQPVATFNPGSGDRPHPEVVFEMPDPQPVTRTRAR
jgi:hypothetical protein